MDNAEETTLAKHMTFSKSPVPLIGGLIDYLDTSLQYMRRKTLDQAENLHARSKRAKLSATFLATVCLLLAITSNVKFEVVTVDDEPLTNDLHIVLMSKEDKLYIDDVDVSRTEAKVQWKKLRDSHREALRRRKPISGHTTILKPWKYEKEMTFLLPQTETIETYTYLSNDSEDTPDMMIDTTDSQNTTIETLPQEYKYSNLDFISVAVEGTPVLSPREVDTKGDSLITSERREKIREERQKQRERGRHVFTDINRFQNDALSMLFNSLCQKTRELPKLLQLRVQREIFNVVSKAEEEALTSELNNLASANKSKQGQEKYSSVDDTITIVNKNCECAATNVPNISTTVKVETEYARSTSSLS